MQLYNHLKTSSPLPTAKVSSITNTNIFITLPVQVWVHCLPQWAEPHYWPGRNSPHFLLMLGSNSGSSALAQLLHPLLLLLLPIPSLSVGGLPSDIMACMFREQWYHEFWKLLLCWVAEVILKLFRARSETNGSRFSKNLFSWTSIADQTTLSHWRVCKQRVRWSEVSCSTHVSKIPKEWWLLCT